MVTVRDPDNPVHAAYYVARALAPGAVPPLGPNTPAEPNRDSRAVSAGYREKPTLGGFVSPRGPRVTSSVV